MFLVSACSCLCTIYWSQVLNGEWGWSWSSADRRCSNYSWWSTIKLPTKVRPILETWRYVTVKYHIVRTRLRNEDTYSSCTYQAVTSTDTPCHIDTYSVLIYLCQFIKIMSNNGEIYYFQLIKILSPTRRTVSYISDNSHSFLRYAANI